MIRPRAYPNDELIRITATSLVRVDGIGVFRSVVRGGKIFLEFCDNDRLRIKCRGTKFVEVPLDTLLEKLYSQIPEVEDEKHD